MFGLIRSLFVVAVAVAAVSAGTYSYFSSQDTSAGNTITAGTLSVDLLNQNETTPLAFAVTGMFPGDEQFVNFDVKNNSTETINLRGYAQGTWDSVAGGVDSLMQVTKVEYWDGDSWETINSAAEGITGVFYYSPNGTNAALFDVAPNGTAQFRLTVKLDELAGNIYQGEQYNASVTVEGKQSISGTEWSVGF